MREIKFRGKDIKNGEWVYGDLHLLCNAPHIHTQESRYPFAGIRSFVNKETIGQFTGLHDKNGKEIYEGDIIDIYDSEYETHDNNEVSFKDGVFGVANWTGNLTTLIFFIGNRGDSEYSVEVVGNVYDNPELLKEQR